MYSDDKGPPTKNSVPGEVLIRQVNGALLFPDNKRQMENLPQGQVPSTLYCTKR
jgi:hypothetical protein